MAKGKNVDWLTVAKNILGSKIEKEGETKGGGRYGGLASDCIPNEPKIWSAAHSTRYDLLAKWARDSKWKKERKKEGNKQTNKKTKE